MEMSKCGLHLPSEEQVKIIKEMSERFCNFIRDNAYRILNNKTNDIAVMNEFFRDIQPFLVEKCDKINEIEQNKGA